MTAPNTMPHSEPLERIVLSCILLDSQELGRAALEALSEEDFYAQCRRQLFALMRTAHREGHALDGVLLAERTRDLPNVRAELDALEFHPSVLDLEPLCAHLRALSAARATVRACAEVLADGYAIGGGDPEDFLDSASRRLAAAVSKRQERTTRVAIAEAMHAAVSALDAPKDLGIPTLLRALDYVLGGLKRGKVYVIAGRPGMGKSALAMQCAEAAAINGSPAAVFSLEMGTAEIAARMLSGRTSITVSDMYSGAMRDEAMQRVMQSADVLSKLPMVLCDKAFSIEEIRRSVRSAHVRTPLGLVVVDYLQLVKSSQRFGNREQEVSHISRELKLIAQEFDVPVIAVSQLNRMAEGRTGKRPMLSDLRESGSIEQDADVVILLYREGYYERTVDKTKCEAIVAKHRGGPTGTVLVHFTPEFTRFSDATKNWAVDAE